MIIFLDFAPFEFMGGAERWMVDTGNLINKKEPVTLISVSPKIGNFYSKLVLKRNFDVRSSIDKESYSDKISLTWMSFIPFSNEWFRARKAFSEARRIYLKYELQELLIAFYFGGIFVLKKAIAGFHTPFLYSEPVTLFDKFHNWLYSSNLSQFIFKKSKQIHVITKRDQNLLIKKFGAKNVVYIPNSAQINGENHTKHFKQEINILNIIFVGDLNFRKGTDILLDVIRNSPDNFCFDIVGDGPLKGEVKKIQETKKNVFYHGYLSKKQINSLYKKSDALFLPSRAEGFPLVILEAMSFGLVIVDSEFIHLGLPKYLEYSRKSNYLNYIKTFKVLHELKRKKKLVNIKSKISYFFQNNFSNQVIYPKLSNFLLQS